ncbi:MAG: hypothetical protein HOP07_16050 [Bacteriovoracaceae bacterium]|nr:hypothetical protein [Bacteriovoracaceae bacterium]
MKTIFKIALIFLALTGASTILYNYTNVEFGKVDYFIKHGWFFLFSIALFPRLTLFISGLLVGSVAFGGVIWWLGFFFAPRILVASLATVSYWNTNPILVIISWLIALGGESSEKFMITSRFKGPKRFDQGFSGSTIEAEFKVKE